MQANLNTAPQFDLPPSTEVPQFAEMTSPTLPEQPAAPAQEQIPQDPMPVFEEAPAAPQSFAERWKDRIQDGVAVAKQVGSAVLEGAMGVERADEAGNASDAHMPYMDRVVTRAVASESFSTTPEAGNERAAMWAGRIAKGAGWAVKAVGVARVVVPLVKPLLKSGR